MKKTGGSEFSRELIALRGRAGFATAYAFYHSAGGEDTLKVTFRSYLNIEQGRVLPPLDKVLLIIQSLLVTLGTPQAEKLAAAWLRDLGGEEFFRDSIAPFLAPPQTGQAGPGLHQALSRSLTKEKFFIKPAQMKAMLSDYETYKCAMALESDTDIWTPASLAGAMGLGGRAAARIIRNLAAVKLLKKERGGWRSVVAGRMSECPDLRVSEPEMVGVLNGYLRRMIDEGAAAWSGQVLVRAEPRKLMAATEKTMTTNVSSAQAFAVSGRTSSSAMFYVSAIACRLWDFPEDGKQ